MASSLRDRLLNRSFKGPVLLDGGTGSVLLERLGTAALSAGTTTSVLNLASPDLVLSVHREFLTAGAEIIMANSFGASRPYLENVSLADRIEEINRVAATTAREAIRSVGRDGNWIAGSIAPLAPNIKPTDQQDIFLEQALLLLKNDVDMLVCETFMEMAQVERAVAGCRRAMSVTGTSVPLVVSLVPRADGITETELGYLEILRQSGEIDLVGLNCGEGIEATRLWLEELSRKGLGPFWLKPSGGLPAMSGDSACYRVEARRFADEVASMVKNFPVAAVGGCCGITPECIGVLNARLDHIPPKEMAKI
jgi:5-methyltetrahydrofolate--homocysteine methyltransferase